MMVRNLEFLVSHLIDLIELNPLPRLSLEPRLREFAMKKQQELRKQSQDFERKEKLLFEALKRTAEENATFKRKFKSRFVFLT